MALQYNEVVADQQGKTPDQIAATAQSSTLPATTNNSISTTGSSVVGSSSLSSPSVGNFDIQSLIKANTDKQDKLFNTITGYFTPTPEENLAQQQASDSLNKYNDLQTQIDTEQNNTNDQISRLGIQPGITTAVASAQQNEEARQSQQRLSSLGIQANAAARSQQAAISTLQNSQASRSQKLQAAQFLYSAGQNDLQNTIAIYKATAPENIGTQVNPTTGDVYVITRNPVSGEVTTKVAGNVGAQKSYTSTQIVQDKNGSYVMIGVKPDGTAETVPLGIQGSSDMSKYLKFTDPNTGSDVYYDPNTGRTINPFNQTGAPNLGASVGTMLGLPTYNTEASNPGVTRSDRNNNPGNIKATSTSTQYPGVIGIESKAAGDGGNFLIFNSAEAGINAIGSLLQSNIYSGLTAEQAIKKYNGSGGYGAADVGLDPNKNFQEQIKDPAIRSVVAQNIAKAEGFTGSSQAQSSPNTQIIKNSLNSLLPNLTDSGKQAARTNINSLISQGDEKAAADGIISTAISALPTTTREKVYGKYTAVNQLNEIEGLLKEYEAKGGKTDIFTGTQEQVVQKLGQTTNSDLAYIGNRILGALVAYRSAVSGANFTEDEKKQYTAMFPSIGKSGALNSALINSLRDSFNTDIRSNLEVVMGAGNYEKLQGIIQKSSDPYQQYISSLENQSPEDSYVSSVTSQQNYSAIPGVNYTPASPVNNISMQPLNTAPSSTPVSTYQSKPGGVFSIFNPRG